LLSWLAQLLKIEPSNEQPPCLTQKNIPFPSKIGIGKIKPNNLTASYFLRILSPTYQHLNDVTKRKAALLAFWSKKNHFPPPITEKASFD
jgi:hypothetical protein